MTPDERHEIRKKAADANAFVVNPFYKVWLDHAESLCNARLQRLRDAPDNIPEWDLRGRWLAWREAEQFLVQMQAFPVTSIEMSQDLPSEPVQQNLFSDKEETRV